MVYPLCLAEECREKGAAASSKPPEPGRESKPGWSEARPLLPSNHNCLQFHRMKSERKSRFQPPKYEKEPAIIEPSAFIISSEPIT